MLIHLLQISLGAVLGALARYFCTLYLPFPVLLVNSLGSLLIGFISQKLQAEFPHLAPLIIIGFFGSFTTFSAFSMEIVNGLTPGFSIRTVFYMFFSLLACILACYFGVKLGAVVFK
jgi:CrcB protein